MIDDNAPRPRRRDVLHLAAVAGAACATTRAQAEQPTDIDITKIAPGSGLKLALRGQPIFIRHLTPSEVSTIQAVAQAELRDPETLEERTRPGHREWLIVIGICPHLGCTPLGIGSGEPRGRYGGFLCPCHGSQFDVAGRVRAGPAPTNLEVPAYRFLDDRTVRFDA
jgi:ubiquinol-cytochrome c reductase iron-sulfur subunit